MVGQKADLGHIIAIDSRPDLAFEPSNVRLEHASCNRAGGQKMTVAKVKRKRNAKRLPGW